MEKKIYIKNNIGEEKEYTILCSLEMRGKKVITYTNYDYTKENNIICYSSYLVGDKLEKIEEEEVLVAVDELLKTITATTKEKYQLLKQED